MKNRMCGICGSISWIFVVHTIFQGLGERFRLRGHAEIREARDFGAYGRSKLDAS
jgi:hypothetical protein